LVSRSRSSCAAAAALARAADRKTSPTGFPTPHENKSDWLFHATRNKSDWFSTTHEKQVRLVYGSLMGMPLGGGSAWAHHADSFEFLDERGQLWARSSRSVSGRDLDVSFPYVDTPYTGFFLFKLWLDDDRVTWNVYTPTHRQLTWTAAVPAGGLIGASEIQARRYQPSEVLDTVHAYVDEHAGGLTILDATRTPRIRVRLGGPDPAWPTDPTAGVQGAVRKPSRDGSGPALVSYCFEPANRLRVVQTSMP
jgi:hypothetical protein